MLEAAVYVAVAFLVVLIPGFYWWRESRKSKSAEQVLTRAVESGRDEPPSLHPVIDPNICIGSGACVRACPEQNVLGLINNAGKLISPSNCIGHGLCQAACPVDAITLVFGTKKRGVDIPHLKGSFETNVPGCYIAGELGGMGLIRNAVTQGRQAATFIAKSLEQKGKPGVHDLLIVGAGPAGIAASLQAKEEGLDFVTVDQNDLGGTILSYPRRKLVMTQPMDLPGYGSVKVREIVKESLLDIFVDVFQKTDLTVRAGVQVTSVARSNGHFHVDTDKGGFDAQRILLAIGRRGSPRKLNVPGEAPPRVLYCLTDPDKFTEQRILVVGGGDSAVEAAVSLSEIPSNTVHLSYRRDSIFRCKEGNLTRLQTAIDEGRLTPLYSSEVTRIEPGVVLLEQNGESITLDNDQVFVFAGGVLPTKFLEEIGIEFTRKFGES